MNDVFIRARLKLTAFYGVSVLLIVLTFSLGIYIFFGSDMVGEFEYEGNDSATEQALEQEFVDVAQGRLQVTLIVVDLGATLLALAIGWMLAGRTLKPIRETMGRHQQFISDAAHELRTPLAVMRAGLDTVDSGAAATLADYRLLAADLHEEIDRMVDLADDLLLLARSDQSTLSTSRGTIALSQICGRQLKLILPYAKQQGVKIIEDIEEGLTITGDENQMERLILNLLKNAIDYNQEGGRVTLSLAREGTKAVITVSDTGMGISREDLDKVFGRFYKADAARERKDSGSGLGLSIAREIIRGHQGEVNIESNVGEGTTVTVRFDLHVDGG